MWKCLLTNFWKCKWHNTNDVPQYMLLYIKIACMSMQKNVWPSWHSFMSQLLSASAWSSCRLTIFIPIVTKFIKAGKNCASHVCVCSLNVFKALHTLATRTFKQTVSRSNLFVCNQGPFSQSITFVRFHLTWHRVHWRLQPTVFLECQAHCLGRVLGTFASYVHGTKLHYASSAKSCEISPCTPRVPLLGNNYSLHCSAPNRLLQ